MKKILLFFVFLTFIFGLAACKKEIDFNLEAPANVTISNGVVSWDAVKDADSYLIFIDQNQIEVKIVTTSYDLKNQNLSPATYNVAVVAVKDDKMSLPSTVIEYVVEGSESTDLAAPTNVKNIGGVISWDAATGATTYEVHVGTMNFAVTGTSLDLNTKSIPVGNYTVYVIAVQGTKKSANSLSVSYQVEQNLDLDATKLELLKVMESTYKLDAELDDFENESEYIDYLGAVALVDAYIAYSVSANMSKNDTIGFFTAFSTLTDNTPEDMTVASLMTQLDIFNDYNMEAEDLANLIYNLLPVMVNEGIRHIERNIARNEEDLVLMQNQINQNLAIPELVSAENYFKTFATTDQIEALEKLFSGEYNALINATYDIRQMLIYFGYDVSPYDYDYDGEDVPGYVSALIEVMTAMAADTNGRIYLTELDQDLHIVRDINNLRHNIKRQEYYGAREEERLLQHQDLKATFVTRKDDVLASLEIVFEFILTLKETAPDDLITRIDNAMTEADLTTSEMLLIKDELVDILRGALPSASDFETLYETMFALASTTSDIDLNAYSEYAMLFGQAHYLSFDLLLSLLSNIDEDLLTAGKGILADALTQGDYYDFEGHPEVAIDFALFIINFLETFALENQTNINLLTGLVTDDILEDVYATVLDSVLEEILRDEYMMEEDVVLLTELFTELKLNYQTYKALIEVFGDRAYAVISYLIDSEASLLKTLINLDRTPPGLTAAFFVEVELLIDELQNIDATLFDSMTTSDLDVLFAAVRIPLKTVFKKEDPTLDFDSLYEALAPKIKTVILNVIVLKSDFMVQAELLDIVAYINNQNITEPNMAVFMALIEALDKTLTEDNKALIFATIDVIFDDILANTTIMELSDMDPMGLDAEKLDFKDTIELFINEIAALALLDIDNLTSEDEGRIMDFMLGLEMMMEPQPDELP